MNRNRQHRNQSGSMLFLIVCVTAVILIPLTALLLRILPHFLSAGRVQDVVDAASLLAANDLSRIVINDENFGYVSLSNYPPVGKATKAEDGEPLPVIGINTLLGTIRQNSIIADEINNQTIERLVTEDATALESTIKELNSALTESLGNETGVEVHRDIHGNRVQPTLEVEEYLRDHLPPTMELESVKLTNGWLEGGGSSETAAPKPVIYAQAKAADIPNGQYKAFTDFSVGRKKFSFAAVGEHSTLVTKSLFHEADGKHISSIVLLQCTIAMKDDPTVKFECTACAQPYARPDLEPGGGMTVRFPGRPVAGLMSWNDFLSSGNFRDNKITNFDIVDGDYPFERTAQMKQSLQGEQDSTSQQFAETLYCWLRNGRLRPRVDAVLSMINDPFTSQNNQVYTYSFTKDGSIARLATDGTHFARPVVADGQVASMADTRLRSGMSPVIFFRNNVKHAGSDRGKHGGQPLAGYPIKGDQWGLINHEQLTNEFCKRDAHPHGLALDVEIGGTRDSTARADVLSMIQRTRSRKI
ncbi:MAG: hypothetical protein K2W95_28615 [Candidatus Obscuribacterales bacterium]|nr:hypothetical protein [Candidatus Obscuribacterales bacterium]